MAYATKDIRQPGDRRAWLERKDDPRREAPLRHPGDDPVRPGGRGLVDPRRRARRARAPELDRHARRPRVAPGRSPEPDRHAGAADFQGDAFLALSAVDAALVAVDGKDGVKVQTRSCGEPAPSWGCPASSSSRASTAARPTSTRALSDPGVVRRPLLAPLPARRRALRRVGLEPKSDRARLGADQARRGRDRVDERLMSATSMATLSPEEIRRAFVEGGRRRQALPRDPDLGRDGPGIGASLDTLVSFFPLARRPARRGPGRTARSRPRSPSTGRSRATS